MHRAADQHEAERASLRELLAAGQARLDVAMAAQQEEMTERERAVASASVAQAERRLLHELSSRVQEQLMHERAATVALRGERDAERKEYAAAIEGVRSELVANRERVATLEAERQGLHQRLGQLEAQCRAAVDESANRDAERLQLIETCNRQDAQLHEQRGNASALESERARSAALQQARDVAEEGRVKAQEQLASMAERLQVAKEERRVAETNLREAKTRMSADDKWESRYHEVERERARAAEALQAATTESKAVAEREQVLLHRLALRERLVQVDWSRGAEVVQELRATSLGGSGQVSPKLDSYQTPRLGASTSPSQAGSVGSPGMSRGYQ